MAMHTLLNITILFSINKDPSIYSRLNNTDESRLKKKKKKKKEKKEDKSFNTFWWVWKWPYELVT